MEEHNYSLLNMDYIFIVFSVLGNNFVSYFFFSTNSLFADTLTGTARFAGFLILTYSLTALVSRPLFGSLSDRHGRVKFVRLGAAMCTVSCVLYSLTIGLASSRLTTAIVLMLLINAVNGTGMGMNQTCAGAAVPDIVPKEKLAQGVGIFGLCITIAQALGPFIALTIIGSGGLNSFRTLYSVAAVLCGFSLICGCLIRYERNKKLEKPATSESVAYKSAKREPSVVDHADNERIKTFFGLERQIVSIFLITTLIYLGLAGVMSYLTLFAKTRGFRVEFLGIYFFINAAGVMASRIIFGRIVDRRGGDIVIIPGMILTAVCLAAIPFAPSLPILICIALPYGIATGAVTPSLNSIMFKRCSPKRRGAVAAAYYVAIDIGISVGTPLMGFIADFIDFSWVYWLSSILVGSAALIFILLGTDMRYKRKMNYSGNVTPE